MKNIKGFTLIEIIICIALISVVATVSFVGVNTVVESNKITSLSDAHEDIMTAYEIYLETNNNISDQLYNAENAIVTPISLLVDEGLLDLSDTDIPQSELNNNFIITSFMSDVKDDYKCIEAKDLTTVFSWQTLSEPLYICTTYNIDTVVNNYYEVREYIKSNTSFEIPTNERYYLDPMYNYVKYEKDGVVYNYRMLYVDVDNTYVLINKGSFGSVFDGYTDSISVLPNLGCGGSSSGSSCISIQAGSCGCWIASGRNAGDCCGYRKKIAYNSYNVSNKNIVNGETNIDLSDIKEAIANGKYTDYRISQDSYDSPYYVYDGSYMDGIFPNINKTNGVNYGELSKFYKIRIKSCLGIQGGTGRLENPFILKDMCDNEA